MKKITIKKCWFPQKKYSLQEFHPVMRQLFFERLLFCFFCFIILIAGSLAMRSLPLFGFGILSILFFIGYLLYFYWLNAADHICNITAQVIEITRHTNFMKKDAITSLDITFQSYIGKDIGDLFVLKVSPLKCHYYHKGRCYELFVNEHSIMTTNAGNYVLNGIIKMKNLQKSSAEK